MNQKLMTRAAALATCTLVAGSASADLLGLEPVCPEVNHDTPGSITFNVDTMRVTVIADLTTMRILPGGVLLDVDPTGDPPMRFLTIEIYVDENGDLIAGSEGPDLKVFGEIDTNGDGHPEYAGVLLTGEIQLYGWNDNPAGAREQDDTHFLPFDITPAEYDFLFTPTGGAIAPMYEGQSVGVTVKSGVSTFHGTFEQNWGGTAEGILGATGDTGACCYPDGSCEEGLTRDECIESGGTYIGDGVPCQPGTCRIPKGACCHPDGSCDFRARERCEAVGGAFQGVGSLCENVTCVPGACCLPDGGCEVMTEGECDDRGGEYQGDETPCDEACGTTGACCLPDDGDCDSDSDSDSDSGSDSNDDGDSDSSSADGDSGSDSNCDGDSDSSDDDSGSDSNGDGDSDSSNGDSDSDSGSDSNDDGDSDSSDGDSSDDGSSQDPPPCEELTEEECEAEGGVYQGDGTTCDDDACVVPEGACCLPEECDGDSDSDSGSDSNDDGDSDSSSDDGDSGSDSNCDGDSDSSDGDSDWSGDDSSSETEDRCQILTQEECESDGGVYQGDDTNCEDTECREAIGACCLPGDEDSDSDSDSDNDGDSDSSQDGTDSDSDSDSENSIECEVLSEAECEAGGGVYHGDGTNCDGDDDSDSDSDSDGDGDSDSSGDGDSSSEGVGPCAQGINGGDWRLKDLNRFDLNWDGIVNEQDVAELMVKWGTCKRCPADLTGNGIVDMEDVLKLLGEL